jgi:hypothetical protein
MYEHFEGFQQRNEPGRFRWFVFGALAGAGVMYLLDPQQGRRRRALARDKAVRLRNSADTLVSEEIPKRVDYLGGFAQGARHAVMETLQRVEHPAESDQVLVARVMSSVFRDPEMQKGSVNVDAAGRVVTLRGFVEDPSLTEEIERRVRAVDGVHDVVNLINQPDTSPAESMQEQTNP